MDVYQIDNLSRSIITLLRDPFFQIPVGSFIDENCDGIVNFVFYINTVHIKVFRIFKILWVKIITTMFINRN